MTQIGETSSHQQTPAERDLDTEGNFRAGGLSLSWSRLDHPAIWLAYLPLLFIPWFIEQPSLFQMIAATGGLIVFLGLYFAAFKATGARLIAMSVATLLVSFSLAFTGSNWTVIAIYAAAMIGNLRPPRQAAVLVGAFAAATGGLALVTQQPATYWVFGIFLMVMVGAANISRAALEDKNRALAESRDEVRQLAAAAERERIGRDLHDLLGRTLTLIAIKADLAAKLVDRDAEDARNEMRDIAGAARQGLADVRSAVSGMTGATLSREIAGSQAALGVAGIVCTFEGDADRIDPGTSAVLSMALREAVTNVIRHSGASRCEIAVRQLPAGLEMVVSDNGNGEAVRAGGGISGLRSRLAAAGGDLAVRGTAKGTQLIARLPQDARP
jgi:two-component system sensor histidine kinase DesK